jgi:Ca2+-binding RTX toxin-like protein
MFGGAGDDVLHADVKFRFGQPEPVLKGVAFDGCAGNYMLQAFDPARRVPFGPFRLIHATDDTLDGGDGNDVLNGQDGDDLLSGGTGNDLLDGGLGDDFLLGGAGDDSLDGSTGRDTFRGEEGDDVFSADYTVDDDLSGGAGDDTILGSGTLDGGDGADVLRGDGTLAGGNGHDDLTALGEATLIGGAGDDILTDGIVMEGGAGDDVIISLTGRAILAKGGAGDDRITGTGTLVSREGADTIRDGDDRIDGGRGFGIDVVLGRGGADTFVYATGDDPTTASTSRILTGARARRSS